MDVRCWLLGVIFHLRNYYIDRKVKLEFFRFDLDSIRLKMSV